MRNRMAGTSSSVILLCAALSLCTGRLSGQVSQEWVARYSGPGTGSDEAFATAVDAAGNIYVAGRSETAATGYDYITIKYDAQGSVVWTARYNGPGNGGEYAAAIAVDGAGTVYVTGWSEGSGTGWDFATIQYDPEGNEVWVARYNGPGNDDDGAGAIAVDDMGNVYVTGGSDGTGTLSDYTTIKYDSEGNEIWVARYDGPGNSHDEAASLAVDAAGRVTVTGYSQAGATQPTADCTTIQYDAGGTALWVSRYDGGYGSDKGYGVALGGQGSVYVTGSTRGDTTGDDYLTIKYDGAGNEVWAARYDGPGNELDRAWALVLDGMGNVCVMGQSVGAAGDFDYATLKYDAAGNELWVARYDGPDGLRDSASDLVVDPAGNVYVTGQSDEPVSGGDCATIKISSAGDILWAARYNGPENGDDWGNALSLDSVGNITVVGATYDTVISFNYLYDSLILRYDAQGNQIWVARYQGPGSGGDAAAAVVVVDDGGLVTVTGESSIEAALADYATARYDAQGNELWIARYDGPGGGSDRAAALAVDEGGNAFVTGGSERAGTSSDFATVKYDAAGNEVWVGRYDGPGNGGDLATALALGGAGNVHVTGGSVGMGGSTDYATIKYDADGDPLWIARYDGPEGGDDEPLAMALDDAGNVYVTGRSRGGSGFHDYATVKYDPAGNELWVARYDGPAGGDDRAQALAVDGQGNVYVTGWSEGIGTSVDYATVKYDAAGNELWVARYDGPDSSFDAASSMALDPAGNICVTGASEGVGTSSDYATVKYDTSGNELWVARYDGPASLYDQARKVATDGGGGVYVTGWSTGSDLTYDYATIVYDGQGTELWVGRYGGPGQGDDFVSALAVDGARNIYVTGESPGSGTGADYATIKYRQEPVGIGSQTPPGGGLPRAFNLAQNSPNPFNPSTVIHYSIPAGPLVPGQPAGTRGHPEISPGALGSEDARRRMEVTLEVFNVRGERVATLVREQQVPGTYLVRWNGRNDVGAPLPSGIYFCQLRAGGLTATRKMALLK